MTPIHPKHRGEVIKTIKDDQGIEHNFYLISNADEILHTRYMVAEVQELYIRAGLSQEFLIGFSQLLIDRAMEAKDLKQLKEEMVIMGQNMKGRLSFMAELKMYEELACVLFMMDDEPAEYLPEWQERKKEVWEKERDFFLFKAFVRINPSQNISMKDILAVFKAVDERLAQLPTLWTNLSSKNGEGYVPGWAH